MGKTIGIVTWFKNGNYGGTLQAYALQRTLESLGYNCEFIDFCPEAKSVTNKVIRFLKDIAIFLYKPKLYQSRRKIYKFVEDNLKVSPPYYTYSQLRDTANERYVAAICGSDQIWSNVGGKINPLYYLTFIDAKKRIAYAPSIGYNQIPAEVIDIFKKYVNEIKYLSVREEHGAVLIKEATGRYAHVVLDPSLLLTKEQWETDIQQAYKRCEKILPREEYIFCYFLGNNAEYIKYAHGLSKLTGYTLISVESKRLYLPNVKKVIADPFEFLYILNNASYVLTDSFHGTALSINFGKQFGVFKRFSDDDPICQNSRIYNILQKTCLEKRLITPGTPLSLFVEEKIDYTSVHKLLAIERKKSLEYLKNSLVSVINEL